MSLDDAAYFGALPKAELHLHLDGSVRPATVLDLASQQDVRLPTTNLDQLRLYLEAPADCQSLVEYISYFELPIAVMQTAPALERVIQELCRDLADDGVRYAEIRYAPWLHVVRGLSVAEVIRAALRGLKAGQEATGIAGGLIVTAMRDMPVDQNVALAKVAGHFAGEGIVGFDLAGDEESYPPGPHAEAFRMARSFGLPVTIHAGEAAGAESVRQAIGLGARRIGHGIRAEEDPAVLKLARDEGVQFDTAPTSNAHTTAVRRLEAHPLARFFRQGIKVTVSSDSRTVSQTTLTNEYAKAGAVLGCTRDELWAMNLQALDSAFTDEGTRTRLRREFVEEAAALSKRDTSPV